MNEFSDPTPIASSDAFKKALLKVRNEFTTDQPFSESKEQLLLEKHYEAPAHTISSRQLAERVGYPSYSAANLRYGLFASRVAAALGYRPGPFVTIKSDNPHWWRTLAYGSNAAAFNDNGEYEWVMRPELCEALEILGWVRRKH